MFFREHDPTRKAKCQYKSAVWWHSEEQRAKVQEEVARLEAKFGVKLATTVDPAKEWYDAEEYHQKFLFPVVRS
ncbi:hypothetical protein HYH03_001348 [Edaphochlamys debaryana]|uniref:peptide-methionine (S)-S-oxide reductase n=1 Tax=Edaphochlamys debaryana TaxID=47281 RepID=A0A835YF23_9CHLO|nr:hypothetical protein HYH03_001348 [Edaphochlamys debaryana]|eukprot:KAG2500579.1 hypothetical protein HYH03_001348 [Edaphochlamys debaryana]